MASGAQRFARQQIDRLAGELEELPQATVTTVAAGAGADGLDVVTVSMDGASIKCAHLSSYTPVVNHVVVLARYAGGWLILGRPIGFPTAP